jgi:hypothetical protein
MLMDGSFRFKRTSQRLKRQQWCVVCPMAPILGGDGVCPMAPILGGDGVCLILCPLTVFFVTHKRLKRQRWYVIQGLRFTHTLFSPCIPQCAC